MAVVTFDKINYRYFLPTQSVKSINKLIGFDTEAYTSGRPFLYCTSDGDIFTYDDIPLKLFTGKYRSVNFCVWNLKYDSGSILYHLPDKYKSELSLLSETYYRDFKYKYFPHKMLRISYKSHSVTFWDIMPFYAMGLDKAAEKYLDQGKIEIQTKKFTPEYVNENYETVKNYCIHDAVLTVKLGNMLLDGLHKYNIYPNSLYSPASVSFKFFGQQTKIVDVSRIWLYYKDCLRYAFETYKGGKFEVSARGRFKGYLYDISSAYPYEISKLINIKRSRIVHSEKYLPDAKYGFMKCHIDMQGSDFHSVALKRKTLSYYPVGRFNAFITNNEYEYLLSIGAYIKIFDGWYIYPMSGHRPYEKIVKYLYDIKEKPTEKYDIIKTVAKAMLNSFYGKMIQKIRQPDGTYLTGTAWNPIYGAIITANIRIQMSKLQYELDKKCLAVHTDSLITKKPLPEKYLGKGLGKFQLKYEGKSVIISSGIYQVGSKIAGRGFASVKRSSWLDILKQAKNKDKIEIIEQRVISWRDAIKRGKPEETNLFIDKKIVLNLNCDAKRLWLTKTNASNLLSGLEYSIPCMEYSKPDSKFDLKHVKH